MIPPKTDHIDKSKIKLELLKNKLFDRKKALKD